MSWLQVYYTTRKIYYYYKVCMKKRAPKGTLCTEGFVTVRRTVKTWSFFNSSMVLL